MLQFIWFISMVVDEWNKLNRYVHVLVSWWPCSKQTNFLVTRLTSGSKEQEGGFTIFISDCTNLYIYISIDNLEKSYRLIESGI